MSASLPWSFLLGARTCVCMRKGSNYFRGHGDGGDDAASQP